jgi:hypothetical protein
MNTYLRCRLLFCVFAALVGLIAMPLLSSAVTDNDQDGIDDALEQPGGAGISFNGQNYPPCSTSVTIVDRYTCLSPTSKDIFVYLVTAAGGGFLAQNGLITTSSPVNSTLCAPLQPAPAKANCTGLFGFITAPPNPIVVNGKTTGTIDGLGIGVHVAVVNTAPTNRSVGGSFGQQAVVMTVDESPSAFAFGATDEGTPSNTGRSTIWPVYLKNFINQNVTGGVDTPSIWKPYIRNTGSHELSHAAALTATYNARLAQYHYASGSGTVMDDKVICSSKTKTCNIYDDYASGDRPCLLALASPITNPLQCVGFTIIF